MFFVKVILKLKLDAKKYSQYPCLFCTIKVIKKNQKGGKSGKRK